MSKTFKLSTPDILDREGNLRDPYRGFIAISRYARWLDDKGRRETWTETVDRYVNFMEKHLKSKGIETPVETIEEVRHAITYHHVMPSMRALMTAGPALEKNHIASYNCTFTAVDSIRAFDETLLILMHGCGVGFSVESQHINKIPALPDTFEPSSDTVVVGDSKEEWAVAFRELLEQLWEGKVPEYDMSQVRPKGARLKTFGGRSSGPEPLIALFDFTKDVVSNAAGRRLNSLEAHDIMCKIGEIVVAGGVRRSALISLSDLEDTYMAEAKAGEWWVNEPQRALANNSAVYYGKPSAEVFYLEWQNLYDSKSGERGIVNLDAAHKQATRSGRRDASLIQGVNPCSEIFLRSHGVCNLTEVVVREDDTPEILKEKVRIATILGTWQASLTDFNYLRDSWKFNAEDEALLGVSLTGIFGNKLMAGKEGTDRLAEVLDSLREHSIEVNKAEAARIGINQSAAITAVKPSGSVSQLVGVSSGIHPWYAEKYIRRVRGSNHDPVTQLMKDAGVPYEPEYTKPHDTTVFEFPLEAPEDALLQEDLTALEHLDLWLTYRKHWTEHNPSITVTVEEDEWTDVRDFVYDNFDEMSGVSFLPSAGNHTYQQAPFEAVDEDAFKDLQRRSVSVSWNALGQYEQDDQTTSSQELACVAGSCEVVDILSDSNEVLDVPLLDFSNLALPN